MMTTNGQKSLPAIGFLTIIRDVEHGLFGGYLILNSLGRPLEFHCTAPVRPNRAQEILYGPTLEPYLCGERIGPALLEKAKSQPVAVLTDNRSAMATRQFIETPMMLLVTPPQSDTGAGPLAGEASRRWRIDPPHDSPQESNGSLRPCALGVYQLAVDSRHAEDESVLLEHWPRFAAQIDLEEPFGRIREAIDEARRGVST